MYLEFIIIYVALAIIIGLLVVNLIVTKKGNSGSHFTSAPMPSANTAKDQYHTTEINNNSGMAFCKKCFNQFPANQSSCPYCGTPRK